MFNTPILFLIFNRPVETQIVFNRIREIKPKQLFVACDGARKNNYNDFINCKLSKDIIKQIDWDCEVKTLYRESNLGCGKAVSEAITWFFSEVEQGIILEDDCVPNNSFFRFCEELLDEHKHNENVFHIGGLNFQNGQQRGEGSYYYSGVAHIWGWATWRRAWKKYDFDLKDYDQFIQQDKLNNYFKDDLLKKYWLRKFDLVHTKKLDTWDYQWTYSILNNNGVAIIPNKSLVTNIGFGENATHTTEVGKYSNLKTTELSFPLIHPQKIEINQKADTYFFYEYDKFQIQLKNETSIFYNFKFFISSHTEKLLIKHYFSKKNKITNNVLLVKADSIGDYLLARNVFNYYIQHPSNKKYNFYLLVNIKLKNFINDTDKKLYTDIIYFENGQLNRFISLMKFYFQLKKYKFNTVINTVYSRTNQIDLLVTNVGSANKIGHLGDCTNQLKTEKIVNDKLYTRLIDISEKENNAKYKHEFYKNNYFFEEILNEKINIIRPNYELNTKKNIDKNKIIIFPGAQSSLRMWSSIKYAELIDRIYAYNNGVQVYVCTSSHEKSLFTEISKNTIQNIIHKIDLNINELLEFISDARCIIGSDSGPAHIVASVRKNYVCLSNANHINRFIPYPPEMEIPIHVVYPDNLDELLKTDIEAVKFFNKESQIDIKTISVEKVYNKVIEVLNI